MGNVQPDSPIELSNIPPNPDDRSIPAAIRHNNPGAMWPGPSSEKFGATGYQMLNDGLGQGNRIATFPTPEQGGAALFDLLDRRYTGKTLADAIDKWSGGNSSSAYAARVAQATGLTPDTVLTRDMVRDPATALAIANAMAGHEAGRKFPMPEGGWNRAHALFLAGGMNGAAQGQAQSQPTPPPQSTDPAATAFLTGQQPQAPAPMAMPRMPEIAMPKVATGVPQVNVPQPRLSPDDLARAGALANNPFAPPGARMQAQTLVQEEMQRRNPEYATQLQQQAMEMELKRRQLAGEVSPMDAAKLQMDLYRQQVDAAKADPNYMTAADRARLEIDRKRFELDSNKAPTQDIAEYEYARRQGYMGSLSDFMAEQKRAGATTINNTSERAFEKETGTALAKRFDGLASDGDAAANDLQVLGSLREQITKVPTGFNAVMQQWAGSVGIKTEGSSSVETVNALIARLTPQQRVPGSGATSDFDAKMFRESLPSLMNTPEGNLKIMSVMEGLAQNRLARADIATRVQIGEITPKDALVELRSLQAQARALSDQFKPTGQRSGEATAPANPQGGGLSAGQLDEIRRKYGGGQ